MILQQMELISSTDVVRNLCKKMAPPLVTLLSAEPEIQYVALRNINLIEVDVDFVRKAVRAIGRCAIKLERAAAAKDVVLAEKPVITDDSNQLDSSLLDELLANIATLSSVYHKPPDAFVTRVLSSAQKTEDEDYPEGSETGYSESSAHPTDGPVSPSIPRQSAPVPVSPPTAPVPDLLGDLMGMDNSIVPLDEPATPTG
ncbi:Beta-adaptin-like protein C [Senna tora]|uniref:Beta-adaptin-like protein C n=1 Tax=Senna tora TaxID=362788 RepID=A0A834WWJ8_9FABA|nr:Beta-adaptin-like protein C [Senna tora]